MAKAIETQVLSPLVSIVVPAYNAEAFLRSSLDSIVGQSYAATEILLMDDSSTDGTGKIAQSYGDRIIYHRQPRNRGQFGNVDDGIALARGKYIAVYHSDDIYEPEIVAREVAFLERHPEAGAVFALDIFINAEGKEWGRLKLPPSVRGKELLDYRTILNTILCHKNCIFRAPSSMVRADVYRTVGPYRGREFPAAGDFEMFFRIARHYPVGILEEYLFRYRMGLSVAHQSERTLRTAIEPYFIIVDEHLACGASKLADPASLDAYEAHRSEDALMRAVSCYIINDRIAMRSALKEASCRHILASNKVQRYRLTTLYILLALLARLPQMSWFEWVFRKRWYGHIEPARFEQIVQLRKPGGTRAEPIHQGNR
jgi:glycosyltransferase involved in cell wall biosynthesis